MHSRVTRRDVLAVSAVAGAGMLTAGSARAAAFQTKLHKAEIVKNPTEAVLGPIREAGFDGVEVTNWNVTPEEAEKGRRIAEKLGLRIHSVMRGWANFNSPDKAKVEADIQSVETALKAAQAFGADTVLLVPCRVGASKEMPIPQPWEFDVEMDDAGHVRRVVKGDNAPYGRYIEAQNLAIDTTRAAVTRLIPVAEKTGVIIALENVWNNLWVKPAMHESLVSSFACPKVRMYFDIGNHVKYITPPQDWIRTLGGLIAKCHVKDYKLAADGHGGNWAPVYQGSIQWAEVRRALDEIGYNGWLSNEGDCGRTLKDQSARMQRILDGEATAG